MKAIFDEVDGLVHIGIKTIREGMRNKDLFLVDLEQNTRCCAGIFFLVFVSGAGIER